MTPLVSAIMPTRRPEWVDRAVACFLAQTLVAAELVVVNEVDIPNLQPFLPTDPHIKYVRAPAGSTLGALRNVAIAAAQADIIAIWDDDDWWHSTRLERQHATVRDAGATVCIAGELHWRAVDGSIWRFAPAAPDQIDNSAMWRRRADGGPWCRHEDRTGETINAIREYPRESWRVLHDPFMGLAYQHGGNTIVRRMHTDGWTQTALTEAEARSST